MANVNATLTLRLKDLASKEAALAVNKITGSLNTFGTTNAASLGKATTATNALTGSFKNLAVAMGSVVSIQMATSFVKGALSLQSAETALKTATAGFQDFNEAQQFLLETSNKLGLVYGDQIKGYAQLAASAKLAGVSLKDVKTIYLGIAEATTALQRSQEDAYGSMRAVVQMMSKGKVQAEELRGQLGERLPGAAQLAAKALGVTDMELNKLLETGKIYAKDFLPLFGQALRDNYGKAAIEASNTAQAALNRLITAFQMLQKQVMFGEGFEKLKSVMGEMSELMGKTETVKTLKTTIAAFSDVVIFAAKVVGVLIEMKAVIFAVFGLFLIQVSKLIVVFKDYNQHILITKALNDGIAASIKASSLAMMDLAVSTNVATKSEIAYNAAVKSRVMYMRKYKIDSIINNPNISPVIKARAEKTKNRLNEKVEKKGLSFEIDENIKKKALDTAIIAEASVAGSKAAASAAKAGATASEAAAIAAVAAKNAMLAAKTTADAVAVKATTTAGLSAILKGTEAATVKVVAQTGLMATAWVGVTSAIKVATGWVGRFFTALAGPLGWIILISYYVYELAKTIPGMKKEVELIGVVFGFVFDRVKDGLVLITKLISLSLHGMLMMIFGLLDIIIAPIADVVKLINSIFPSEIGKKILARMDTIRDGIKERFRDIAQSSIEVMQDMADVIGKKIFVDVDIRVKGKKEKIDPFGNKEADIAKAYRELYGKESETAAADEMYRKDILAKQISEFTSFAKQIKKMRFDLATEIGKADRTESQQEIRAINEKYDEQLLLVKDKLVDIKTYKAQLENQYKAPLSSAKTPAEIASFYEDYNKKMKDIEEGKGLLRAMEQAREDELSETKSPVKKANIIKEYAERIEAAKMAVGIEDNIRKARASEIAAINKKTNDTYRKEEAALINDLYGLRGQDLDAIIAATKEEEDAVKAKYERLGIITAEGERQLQLIREKGAILANNKRFELTQKEQEVILSTAGLKADITRDTVKQAVMRGEAELESLRIEHEKIEQEHVGHHDILIAEKARYEAAVAKSKSETADSVTKAKSDIKAIELATVEAHNNILNSDKDRAEIAVANAKADRAALDIEYAEKKRLHGDSKEAAIVIEEWYSAKLKEIEKKRTDDSRGALKIWSDTHKEFIDVCEETVVQANESFASGLTNAVFDFIDGTKTAKEAFVDFARSFLNEVAKMIVQQTILNALKDSMSTTNEKEGWARLAINAAMSAYGGTATTTNTGATSGSTVTAGQTNAWTGSAGSSTAVAGWAKGGLFESGIVKAFAKGGVYNKPTIFPMANGMGLMGEAGPEAVMPLRRSAKGELGVIAASKQEDEGRKKKETIKVEIANIVSPELLDSYMATTRGQNAILNVISNKPGMVRRILQAG